uniref:Uncharacterized protein n=1 Tax=Oryza glumipatula TaxID=40148 RepID=A0A0E0AZG1_9ORYZ
MAGGHRGKWRHDHRDGEVQLAFVGGAGAVMSTCRRKFGQWWSIEALATTILQSSSSLLALSSRLIPLVGLSGENLILVLPETMTNNSGGAHRRCSPWRRCLGSPLAKASLRQLVQARSRCLVLLRWCPSFYRLAMLAGLRGESGSIFSLTLSHSIPKTWIESSLVAGC